MGMIENGFKKVKELDKLLTALTNLIKKHWLILIVIAICTVGYYFLFSDNGQVKPVNKTITDTVHVKEIIDTVKVFKTDTLDEQ